MQYGAKHFANDVIFLDMQGHKSLKIKYMVL